MAKPTIKTQNSPAKTLITLGILNLTYQFPDLAVLFKVCQRPKLQLCTGD